MDLWIVTSHLVPFVRIDNSVVGKQLMFLVETELFTDVFFILVIILRLTYGMLLLMTSRIVPKVFLTDDALNLTDFAFSHHERGLLRLDVKYIV